MASPYFEDLADLLATSGVFDEPVSVLMDGEIVEVTARVTKATVREPIGGARFLGESEVVKFAIASLPRFPRNGDVMEKADGSTWRLFDPEDLYEGTVQCMVQQQA